MSRHSDVYSYPHLNRVLSIPLSVYRANYMYASCSSWAPKQTNCRGNAMPNCDPCYAWPCMVIPIMYCVGLFLSSERYASCQCCRAFHSNDPGMDILLFSPICSVFLVRGICGTYESAEPTESLLVVRVCDSSMSAELILLRATSAPLEDVGLPAVSFSIESRLVFCLVGELLIGCVISRGWNSSASSGFSGKGFSLLSSVIIGGLWSPER